MYSLPSTSMRRAPWARCAYTGAGWVPRRNAVDTPPAKCSAASSYSRNEPDQRPMTEFLPSIHLRRDEGHPVARLHRWRGPQKDDPSRLLGPHRLHYVAVQGQHLAKDVALLHPVQHLDEAAEKAAPPKGGHPVGVAVAPQEHLRRGRRLRGHH